MIWEILILLFGIISALYAFPYGIWEFKNQNKSGGILVILIACICIVLSGLQIYL